jgi:poly(A) polymerase
VHFGSDVVESGDFRAAPSLDGEGEAGEVVLDGAGRILRDNIYGGIGEDVWRRDFTANALYYNIADYSVWDYVGGMHDIESGTLRVIGDPVQRYQEDPCACCARCVLRRSSVFACIRRASVRCSSSVS